MILVCGPESSGTRWLAQSVTDQVHGEMVYHRSVPHGWDWNLPCQDCRVVGVIRDAIPNAQSMVVHGHAPDVNTALVKRSAALEGIRAQCAQFEVPLKWFTYEDLIRDPDYYFSMIGEFIGHHLDSPGDVIDGNRKYNY